MNTFIRNIKNHKKAAIICAAVLVTAAAGIVLVILLSGKKKEGTESARTGYFLDTEYPVYVTEKDGSLVFELDGTASSDLKWQSGCDPKSIAIIQDGAEEKKSKLTLTLNPGMAGYTTATFARSGKVAGISYDAVKITADLVTSGTAETGKELHLSAIRQNTALAGALTSDTPYLVQGSRVILPNGGDWTLSLEGEENVNAAIRYSFYTSIDDEGYEYLGVSQTVVDPNPPMILSADDEIPEESSEESSAETDDGLQLLDSADSFEQPPVFLLRSESLGIEQRLTLAVDSDMQSYLCKAEETDGK